MDVELNQSHRALPASAALEVAVLLKATPGGGPRGRTSVHAGWCLDCSGSMAEKSGLSGLTKLEALKAATQHALALLEPHGATVTVCAFDDRAQPLCLRESLGGGGAHALGAAVEALRSGGGTEARLAMDPVLEALKPVDHAARRLILVTDGHFNSGSVKAARKLAAAAGEHGVAVWAFATGVSYDEAYLRELVGLGAPGGLFHHVRDLGGLGAVLREELTALTTAPAHALGLELRPANGVRVLEVLRLVPAQSVVTLQADGSVRDHVDVVDGRGQAWVVRVELSGAAAGRHPLLQGQLRWREAGVAQVRPVAAELEVLPAGALAGAPNSAVVSTVLMAQAAQATVMGQAALATHLYAAAGQTQLAQQLQALGTALPGGGDAARALRTQVLGSTRLVALGTAQSGTKGGTP